MVASVLPGVSCLPPVTLRLQCFTVQAAEMTFTGPRKGGWAGRAGKAGRWVSQAISKPALASLLKVSELPVLKTKQEPATSSGGRCQPREHPTKSFSHSSCVLSWQKAVDCWGPVPAGRAVLAGGSTKARCQAAALSARAVGAPGWDAWPACSCSYK